MVVYCVYRFDFLTKKGTKRSYIGLSGNAEERADKLGVLSANWCKPRIPGPPPSPDMGPEKDHL